MRFTLAILRATTRPAPRSRLPPCPKERTWKSKSLRISERASPMKKRKSWREKLTDSKGLPKVETVTGKMTRRWGEGRMVVPAPLEVDALMRQVPRGRLVTINELRAVLASKHKANFACPITTGI